VLHEQVQRTLDGQAGFDGSRLDAISRRGDIHELEHVRGHACHATQRSGTVTASPSALEQPRDALGTADLEHAIDRGEIDAEIEARGRDDAPQPPRAQALFDPFAGLSLERAVVERDQPGPVRSRLEERAIPDLRLRSRVGEYDGAVALLDSLHDRGQHLGSEMPRPWKALDDRRDQRVDDDTLRLDPANHAAGAKLSAEERGACVVEVADGRG
jgi:hypothetical protein